MNRLPLFFRFRTPRNSRTVKRFELARDEIYWTNLTGIFYENEWIRVGPDGFVCLKKGYTSDGNSPVYKLPGFFWSWFGWFIAPPVGPRNEKGLPISYRAFFLHDACIEFLYGWFHMQEFHDEYCRELNSGESANWKLRHAACWLVKHFGPDSGPLLDDDDNEI